MHLASALSSTRLKAEAIKAGGWSNISGLCFIVITIFIFLFHKRAFQETAGKLLGAKIMSLCRAAQTQILSNVSETGRAGSNNKEKCNYFFPPTNKQWTPQFVIYGFHSFKYSLEVFPRGPLKFYHEDSFPHKIPEVRYSFLVAQYSAPQAGNRRFKSSVAHWGFREIKLSSFLTRLNRQKSLHKMQTNKEGFHRLIHHCTQGLDTSVNLFPMDNPICSEPKEGLSHWVSPFHIHHNSLAPVMPMKPPTDAQLGIKVVALLYVFLNPI